jgi:Protein of unknown function (DUF1569)
VKTFANEVDREEVLKRLAALRAASIRRWGKMSCHQMVCHLSDAFLCPLGEKTASPEKPLIPRGIYRWLALYVPVRWPRGIPTRPEMEQGIGGTAPVEFSRDRERVAELVDRFSRTRGRFAAHPIFGEMSEKDWMRWGYLHCDHHLRQFGV